MRLLNKACGNHLSHQPLHFFGGIFTFRAPGRDDTQFLLRIRARARLPPPLSTIVASQVEYLRLGAVE